MEQAEGHRNDRIITSRRRIEKGLNTVGDKGTCPKDGSLLTPVVERHQKEYKITLVCYQCKYEASCYLPWSEFQEDKPSVS